MAKILEKQVLNAQVVKMVVDAPKIAKKCQSGQFIVLRINEHGERIPLTIADYDRNTGTITIIFQTVGKTTFELAKLNEGDDILDFAGPMGKPSDFTDMHSVAVIGGGLGCAIAYPQAKALHEMGCKVDIIAGFKNTGFIILEPEMKAVCENLYITTDDGSNGNKGFVTDELKKQIENGKTYDHVIAIGPLPMMKFVSLLTKEYDIKTIVSMNPIMIDGTGMCGGCRVRVDGKMQFACIDGPDFDGHKVDFDEAIRRSRMYTAQEKEAMRDENCNLFKEVQK